MIPFDPSDLFPPMEVTASNYADAQEHSRRVDEHLGFRIEAIELELLSGDRDPSKSDPVSEAEQQLWIGLPVQAMQTPYVELREILARLSPAAGSTIVDLGAGYGRMAFVIGDLYPEVGFIGYEYVEARVTESIRCLRLRYPKAIRKLEMLAADLSSSDFVPEAADSYFIYDYGTRAAIAKTLGDLRGIAARRPIAVVGRGRASRDAIERSHPWLSQVVKPEHFEHYSIYRSASRN